MRQTKNINNEIVQVETKTLDGQNNAIMVALNMYDKGAADTFVKEVIGKVLMQRLISPPDTDMLCITIVGDVTSKEFKDLWKKHLNVEIPMMVFMKRMKIADVIHGSLNGEVLDTISLLEDA